MYRELATINKLIDLSPQSALDRAETFLTQQGYITLLRTDTSLTVKRDHPAHPVKQGVLALKVVALPQPEGGGVQVKVRGNDQEGIRERQNEWKEWVESLPERISDEPGTETASLHETEGQVPIDDPEKDEPAVLGEEELGGQAPAQAPAQASAPQKNSEVQDLGLKESPEEADSEDEAFDVPEVSPGPTSTPHSVPHLYEYKMVQLPLPLPPPLAAQEEDQEGDKAARHLQAVANEHAEQGWEFYRVDALGDRGGQRQYFVATFRRPR